MTNQQMEKLEAILKETQEEAELNANSLDRLAGILLPANVQTMTNKEFKATSKVFNKLWKVQQDLVKFNQLFEEYIETHSPVEYVEREWL